jgi:raffinose/stachyose/melibiose transport system permease protein
MQGRHPRRVLAIIAALAAALAPAGCSAGDLGSSDSDSATTLSLLSDNSDASLKTAEGLAKAFNATNTGATVKVETRPQGTEGDNVVKTRLSTGDMTDVFLYNSGSLFQALKRALHRRQRRAVPRRHRDRAAAVLGAQPQGGAAVRRRLLGALAVLVSGVVFVVPFAFIVLNAMKDRQESALPEFSWPRNPQPWQNLVDVIEARDYMLVIAFINSTILTVCSVACMVVLAAMVAFVLQRRRSRWNRLIDLLVLSGLIIPPAVVPTIWVLQRLGLFKTMPGLILVEIAFGLSFSILLFRAFIATIPKELDEAATIDGAGPLRLFFRVVLPLLRPVAVTTVVVQSVAVFNDFTNPLYFLPGDWNATVQLTLYNFSSQYNTQYHLLFMNILLITVPPLLMFMFFNRQIVAGMTSGAVKG